MKRSSVLVILSICAVFARPAAAGSEDSAAAISKQPARLVATALDHLTVLEYDEPIVQAAVGSSAFQIERQGNKVFIKPLKPNASTNLFIWTASNQHFSYELSVVDVANMDIEIRIASFKPAPAPETNGKESEHRPEPIIAQTLLGIEPVDSVGVKAPKGGVGLRLEGIFRDKTTLFIRYSLENRSARPYRATQPTLYEIRLEHPSVGLAALRGKQIERRAIEQLGHDQDVRMLIAHTSDATGDIAPGMRKSGVIAVRQSTDSSSPLVLEVVFTEQVKATLVL